MVLRKEVSGAHPGASVRIDLPATDTPVTVMASAIVRGEAMAEGGIAVTIEHSAGGWLATNRTMAVPGEVSPVAASAHALTAIGAGFAGWVVARAQPVGSGVRPGSVDLALSVAVVTESEPGNRP